MATIEWAELSDYVLIDKFGKVSVIGMFDSISATSFPALHPDLWVVAKFRGFPREQVRMEIDFVNPDGKVSGHAGPIESTISSGGTAILAARILNPLFDRPGPYSIRIRPGVGQHTDLTLNVRQQTAPQPSE